MTVVEIVAAYLKANGFDGLYNDNECGCTVSDPRLKTEACENKSVLTRFSQEGNLIGLR